MCTKRDAEQFSDAQVENFVKGWVPSWLLEEDMLRMDTWDLIFDM